MLTLTNEPAHYGWAVVRAKGSNTEIAAVRDWMVENIGPGMPRWFTLDGDYPRDHTDLRFHIMRRDDLLLMQMAWSEVFESSAASIG